MKTPYLQKREIKELSRFPILVEALEGIGSGGEDEVEFDYPPPKDIFRATYVVGSTPDQDRIGGWTRVATRQGVDEHDPFYTPQGRVGCVRDPGGPVIRVHRTWVPIASPQGDRLCYSPDGATMAYQAYHASTSKPYALYLARPDGTEPRELERSRDLRDFSFSPDNKALWVATNGELCRVDRATLQRETVRTQHEVESFGLSPDGATMAYVDPDLALWKRDLPSGRESLLLNMAQGEYSFLHLSASSPRFSPDGSRILCVLREIDFPGGYEAHSTSKLWAVSTADGKPSVVNHDSLIWGLAQPRPLADASR